jgi:hypothetical protein
MTRRPTTLLAALFATLLVLLAACGSDDGGEDGGEEAGPGSTVGGACPSTVFDGTVTREADPITEGHVPVDLADGDLVDGFAVPVGSTTTVYLATYELDEANAGSTFTAPAGETLVTVNVPNEATTDPTGVALIVDSGGGSTSSGAVVDGGVGVAPIEVSPDQVCMSVRVEKDHEAIDGTFSVPVAG